MRRARRRQRRETGRRMDRAREDLLRCPRTVRDAGAVGEVGPHRPGEVAQAPDRTRYEGRGGEPARVRGTVARLVDMHVVGHGARHRLPAEHRHGVAGGGVGDTDKARRRPRLVKRARA